MSGPGRIAWHALDGAAALARLGVTASGLSEAEAAHRLDRHGPNRVPAAPPVPWWRILVDQVTSLVVLLLAAAAVIALLIGDAVEAAAIGAVLLLNTGIGFVVELRARRSMAALLRYEAPRTTVVRDGAVHDIAAQELVPGDVVELEPGDAVPADARMLSGTELRTNEAALTGESVPVDKSGAVVLDEQTPLPERANLVHAGTTVVAGTGRAVVVATGAETELGRIGGLVAAIGEGRTPLERRLDALGRRLVAVALAVALVVTVLGIVQGLPALRMLETGIALAIAAVPEGLPAVATIALAVGLRRMARRRALVRRLHAVEALGSTTVVCTDKTGTLTAGEMTVARVRIGAHDIEVTGNGYAPEGDVRAKPTVLDAARSLARTAVLASHATVTREGDAWVAAGDPTEAALVVFGRKLALERDDLLAESPLAGEVPFSSERRFMATFHDGRGLTAHVKGGPDRVLGLSDRMCDGDGVVPLDDETRRAVLAANDELAAAGLRVLALAAGPAANASVEALGGLVFLGLVGMIDPPAPGVRETIAMFDRAGVRAVMLTGDQRLTAEAIGRELGVLKEGEDTLDGRELAALGTDELSARVGRIGAFSRVSPEDKLKIVEALRAHGDVVAMLGDGVNDAAALRRADIGVAMGLRGTDVAKEAADIVLQDDRFRTIAAAVEEGRVIFDNIRKFVFYLFSCNLAEVLVMLGAAVAGLPLPLLPLQILWLNLVTDVFPALALALEPGEPDVMRRPPRDPEGAILSRRFLRSVSFFAALITIVTLAAFVIALRSDDPGRALTFSFMTLALAQLFHLGNARSTGPVLSPTRVVANRWALGSVALVIGLQLLSVYFVPLATLLDTVPLDGGDWLVILPLAALPAIVGQMLRARA